MITKIHSVTTIGLTPVAIDIEVQSTTGIPQIVIIGLVNTAIRESKDRIITALKHLGIRLKARRTIISLTPAGVKKTGSSFDLAIAVGLLSLYRELHLDLEQSVLLGEVSLDGAVQRIEGCFAKVLAAKTLGYSAAYIPFENLTEVELIQGIKIYGVEKLTDLLATHPHDYLATPPSTSSIPSVPQSRPPQVVGQLEALRALTIAVAGRHNLHLIGPPGVGKTILPKVAQYLNPPLTQAEAVEVLAIHSLHTKLRISHPYLPPFRCPHHSASLSQLLGSNVRFTPGELSLAHNGILFLDELPEFKSEVLQALRTPLEKKRISLMHQSTEVELPSNCLLMAASNPCPCGYWQTGVRVCKCSAAERHRYAKKLSGPLMDRFDLNIIINPLTSDMYSQQERQQHFNFEEAEKRITKARTTQHNRFNSSSQYNASLTLESIDTICEFTQDAKNMITAAMVALKLSTRAYQKLVAVSQTIADLESSPVITEAHCAEALNYRFEQSWQHDTYS